MPDPVHAIEWLRYVHWQLKLNVKIFCEMDIESGDSFWVKKAVMQVRFPFAGRRKRLPVLCQGSSCVLQLAKESKYDFLTHQRFKALAVDTAWVSANAP